MNIDNLDEKNNYGISSEIKEELIKLSRKIEEGTLEANELTEQITDDIAEAFIILAKAVEEGLITDKDLAMYLAMIIRKLTRGKVKSINKTKRKPKTFFDLVLDAILKNVVRANLSRRSEEERKKQSNVNDLIQDLESAITRLRNDPSLDSDLNDLRLMEDVIAVGQKMNALERNGGLSNRKVANSLFSGMAAYASIGGNKGLASLSSLKAEMVNESWSEITEVDLNQASRVVGEGNQEKRHQLLKEALGVASEVVKPSGPNDVPTTESTKQFKNKKNLEWEQSLSLSRK